MTAGCLVASSVHASVACGDMLDLAARLAARGSETRCTLTTASMWCEGPRMLRVEDGTGVVQGHMQDLAASMLKNCTVVELRAVCRHKGIPVEGTRDQLLRRLVIESATGEKESENRAPFTPPRRRRSSAVKPCGPMAENSSEKHQDDVQRLGACIDLQESTKKTPTLKREPGLQTHSRTCGDTED